MIVDVGFCFFLRWVMPSSRRCTALRWKATTRRVLEVSRWRLHPPLPGSPEMLSPPYLSGGTAGRDTVRSMHRKKASGDVEMQLLKLKLLRQKNTIFSIFCHHIFMEHLKNVKGYRINPWQRREQGVKISSLFIHPTISLSNSRCVVFAIIAQLASKCCQSPHSKPLPPVWSVRIFPHYPTDKQSQFESRQWQQKQSRQREATQDMSVIWQIGEDRTPDSR